MTALVTPFAPDETLDLDAIERHVVFQLENDVEVMVVGGTIGEYSAMDLDERRAATERVVQATDGRATVLVGAASDRPEEVREIALHADAAGADGLLAALPPHFKLTESEQFEFWSWLDRESPVPFVLYGAADAASGPPTLDLLDRLRSLHGLVGYKEPRPDLARIQEFVGRFGNELPMVAAAEIALPQALMAGAVGAMTATACFAPHLIQGMIDGVRADDLGRVRDAYAPVLAFRSCFQSRMQAGYPAFLPYTKAACEIVGLPTGAPRRPLHPISPEEYERLEGVLDEVLGTRGHRERAVSN